MSSVARVVVPGFPHHITQRGNRRADIFESGEDRRAYLRFLKQYAERHGLDIWAYTGYTLEELSHMDNPAIGALLQNIDVLVDGKFDLQQRDLTLAFRGSRNQRVIDMEKTRQNGSIIKKILD